MLRFLHLVIETTKRNLVERYFNRPKQFRHIVARYEKMARNFIHFHAQSRVRLHLVSAIVSRPQ